MPGTERERGNAAERCGCGADAGDHHFDRSVCACGSAHYYCNQCGNLAVGETCDYEPPVERDAADDQEGWCECPPETPARLIGGEWCYCNGCDKQVRPVERDAATSNEERFLREEKQAVLATAVGIARLRFRIGDVQGASDILDSAVVECQRKHFDACVADGYAPEEVERLLGPRDKELERASL